jgi:hypothetical protein
MRAWMNSKLFILGLEFILASFFAMSAEAQSPVPDTDLEGALLYKPLYGSCLVASPKTLPFFLAVDESGTGHFADFAASDKLAPNGVSESWQLSKKFLDLEKNKAWTQLSRCRAEELWDKPEGHCLSGATIPYFYTFEATGSYNGERNIYHLDLQFGPDGKIFAYRVRGIGIFAPSWFVLADGHVVKTK